MSNPLLEVGKKFHQKYKTIHGVPFFGQMLQPPDTSRVTNFLSARRYLRTSPTTKIKPRDVIIVNKVRFIVADHGDGFYKIPIYKHFKLFEADEIYEWFPQYKTENPITGVKTINRDISRGNIHLSIQPTSSESDMLQIAQEVVIAVTEADVSLDDRIGDYIVTKEDKVLGISLIHMKKL